MEFRTVKICPNCDEEMDKDHDDFCDSCGFGKEVRDFSHIVKKGDSAYNTITGEYLDAWYCKDSPDHICHHKSYTDDLDDSYITLMDNSKYILPEDHDPEDESWDACIFCGEPEERK